MDKTLTQAQRVAFQAQINAAFQAVLTQDEAQAAKAEADRLAEFRILLDLATTARDAVFAIDMAINEEVEENVPFPVADLLDEAQAILTNLRGRIIRDS